MNSAKPSRSEPYIIDLPRIEDARGNLSYIEEDNTVPFVISRAYWIYDVPGGQERPGHAYYENEEFIVAISGSFDVQTNCANKLSVFSLNRSYLGLYIPRMTWRKIQNFSTNSLCLVLCSTPYSRSDYIESTLEFECLQTK